MMEKSSVVVFAPAIPLFFMFTFNRRASTTISLEVTDMRYVKNVLFDIPETDLMMTLEVPAELPEKEVEHEQVG